MVWKVKALSSGVAPRTEERGWVGRPKSSVGWIVPVVISPSLRSQVYESAMYDQGAYPGLSRWADLVQLFLSTDDQCTLHSKEFQDLGERIA